MDEPIDFGWTRRTEDGSTVRFRRWVLFPGTDEQRKRWPHRAAAPAELPAYPVGNG